MLTIDALRAWGANVDEGLTRCCGNEAFYLRLAGMAAQDGNFARLEEALGAEDYSAAFEAAHALKGVLANLALTPWLAPVSEMTELLAEKGLEVLFDGSYAANGLCEVRPQEIFCTLNRYRK